jgi:hypothetical protein
VPHLFSENFGIRDAGQVWPQIKREGFGIARCKFERLMDDFGLQSVIRGKPMKATIGDKAALCPLDQSDRRFHAPAPSMLCVLDFT